LNTEQARAFTMIAKRSYDTQRDGTTEPLRMYLGGPAGTGKSRVLNALRAFFVQRKQERRLRVCTFMGIAAQNVTGMTLHSALCM
ncbi:hypothetical protein FPV67DRAFT_1381697, partial [Lyophyllum atratum]